MASASDDIGENDAIGPASDRNAFERVRMADELLARAIHCANPCAAGQNERAIDVEQDKFSYRVHVPIYNR